MTRSRKKKNMRNTLTTEMNRRRSILRTKSKKIIHLRVRKRTEFPSKNMQTWYWVCQFLRLVIFFRSERREKEKSKDIKQFQRDRDHLTQQLYKEYNKKIFKGQLPEQIDIRWSNKLNTTAGFCSYKVLPIVCLHFCVLIG